MKHILVFFSLYSSFLMTAQHSNTKKIVQASLTAYNAYDMESFLSFFSDRVVRYTFNAGKQLVKGMEAIPALCRPYFKASPGVYLQF